MKGVFKPIKIHVLRNGESSFNGVSIIVRPTQNLDRILAEVTKAMVHKVFVHRGGVTALHALNGHQIRSIHEFEDGESYVAVCLNERYKLVKYPRLPPRPYSAKSGLSIRSGTPKSRASLISGPSVGHLRAKSGGSLSRKSEPLPVRYSSNVRPRWITIVRYGFKPRNIFRHFLCSKTIPSIEHILSNISELVKLDAGPMYKLYFESCVEVSRVEDFFGNHFIFFAFPKTSLHWDDFELDVQEIEIIEKMNKITARDQKFQTNNVPLQISSIYDINETISCGCFSVLKECKHIKTRENYAMKIINKITGNEIMDNYLSISRNELKILKGMVHENILRVYFDYETPQSLYCVVELFDGGDLKSEIDTEDISEDDAMLYVEHIAAALSHLHKSHIIHRDVSPSNVMISLDGRKRKTLKLTDFGLSMKTTKPLYEICGFLLYMAPEMLRRTGYGQKVDIWAAGVTLYYMLAKCLPFMGKDVDQSRRMIMNGEVFYESPKMKKISEATKYLISLMLYRDDCRRYTAEEVLKFVRKARESQWEDLGSFKDSQSDIDSDDSDVESVRSGRSSGRRVTTRPSRRGSYETMVVGEDVGEVFTGNGATGSRLRVIR